MGWWLDGVLSILSSGTVLHAAQNLLL